MELHEYITTLTEQMRNKKGRDMVAEEIKNHIEDQKDAYLLEGMEPDLAMEEAIKQMGDPVETGLALDKIHRPRMNYALLIVVVGLSIVGILMQAIIFNSLELGHGRELYLRNTIVYTCMGLVLMLGVYFIDYTWLGRYPLVLWGAMTALLIGTSVTARSYNNMYGSLYVVITLFIPLFGGIIYHFRGKGYKGILCSILLLLLPLGIGFKTGSASVGMELFASAIIMLTASIIKGWMGEKKKRMLTLLWVPTLGVPLLVLADIYLLGGSSLLFSYQAHRIKAIFNPSSYSQSFSWMQYQVKDLVAGYTLSGNSQVAERLTNSYDGYIVSNIFSYFGILIGAGVLAIVGILLIKMFKISTSQKNRLGYLVGLGCTLAICIKTVVYVMTNFGLYTFGYTSMPFLSYGLKNTLANFILIGILLSVYRNTTLTSEKSCAPKEPKHEIKFSIKF